MLKILFIIGTVIAFFVMLRVAYVYIKDILFFENAVSILDILTVIFIVIAGTCLWWLFVIAFITAILMLPIFLLLVKLATWLHNIKVFRRE